MITSNKELMTKARKSLSGKWDVAVVGYVIYIFISIVIPTIIDFLHPDELKNFDILSTVIQLLVGPPMLIGLIIFSINMSRNQETKVEQLFDGFKYYDKALLLYIVSTVLIFLQFLLLVVPGIIAALRYSQAFFILAENKSINPIEALKKSSKMMDGYKWKYFCLGLRFIGWLFLCILTFGIGLLWVGPYMSISLAHFYNELKNQSTESSTDNLDSVNSIENS